MGIRRRVYLYGRSLKDEYIRIKRGDGVGKPAGRGEEHRTAVGKGNRKKKKEDTEETRGGQVGFITRRFRL